MRPTYNPFTGNKLTLKTEHGIINKSLRRYFTHRTNEHFFKKYGGFGVSKTEIIASLNNNCDHIIIKYHGKQKNILYRLSFNYIPFLKEYNHEGDEQLIFPVKDMIKVGEEIL